MERKTIDVKIDNKKITLTEVFPNCNYYVSEEGHLYSLNTNKHLYPKKLKPYLNKKGYYKVKLYIGKDVYTYFLHKLICSIYLGDIPLGMECSHKNGIKTDNNISNLIYEKHSDNERRKVEHQTDNRGIKNPLSKFNKQQLNSIRVLIKNNWKIRDIAIIYNVDISSIYNIKHNKTYKYDYTNTEILIDDIPELRNFTSIYNKYKIIKEPEIQYQNQYKTNEESTGQVSIIERVEESFLRNKKPKNYYKDNPEYREKTKQKAREYYAKLKEAYEKHMNKQSKEQINENDLGFEFK